jgi:hypothetical protein
VPQDSNLNAYLPRWPSLTAWVVFIAAALTICWPMFIGQFMLGDDQFIAGYSFRVFGAQEFARTGTVPQWNPYLFGGMPYVAAGHGEIFYPTAMLRWLLPVQVAMNLQIAAHLVLAGWFMYRFALALGVAWGAALGAGLAFELTGIMASMVSPGHDGKMMVTALTPLMFLGLLRAIRDNRISGYGMVALVSGLGLISPHFQMMYYLFVAAGLWTLYLLFLHPERHPRVRWPVALGAATAAVILGLLISAVQVFPFYEYIPWSPRAAEGPSRGWEYATSWSFAPLELATTVLPQFNGVLEYYWGSNPFKMHTEYLGALVVALAALAWGGAGAQPRRLLWALTAIGGLLLLVSFAAHTPFYRLWYEVMPFMKNVRAAGMAFFIPAFVVCIFAAFGLDRVLRRDLSVRQLVVPLGVLAGVALLGLLGVLQAVAEGLAEPGRLPAAMANAEELRLGSVRLMVVMLAGGLVLFAIRGGSLRGLPAALAVALVLTADLWSVNQAFLSYKPRAEITFAEDDITLRIKEAPLPYRVWNPAGRYSGLQVYPPSWLMAYQIPTLLGYHGNELRTFDDLLGGKNDWPQQVSPAMWDLFAVRYILLPEPQPIPGYTMVLGPARTILGREGYLYEADTIPPYVRVMAGALKVPEAEALQAATDPRFPLMEIALYSDTTSIGPAELGEALPPPATISATLVEWNPGRIQVSLEGSDPRTTYLVVAENWYPDWQATVDGEPVPVHRAHHTLLSVELPPGAREVVFEYVSRHHDRFKGISLAAALAACLLIIVPGIRERRRPADA